VARFTTNRLGALAILLVMGLAWGLSFSLGKIAATGGAHPFAISFWQCWTAAVLLIGITFTRRRSISLTLSLIGFFMIIGLLGLVIPTALFYFAASHVPAGVLSLTVALVPILTFVASAIYGLEKFSYTRLAGVALGALAIIFLVAPTASLPDRTQLPWVVLALGSGACYATLNIILSLKKPPELDSSVVTCGMFTAAAVTMVPIVVLTGSFAPLAWPFGPIEYSMLGLGLISFTAYTLYLHLINHAGPVFTSQVANLVTLCGVLWGMILFGERHSAWIWLSLATMMAGVFLVAPRIKAAVATE
jgi:drug/metabolite transporter (DMT)-like permease